VWSGPFAPLNSYLLTPFIISRAGLCQPVALVCLRASWRLSAWCRRAASWCLVGALSPVGWRGCGPHCGLSTTDDTKEVSQSSIAFVLVVFDGSWAMSAGVVVVCLRCGCGHCGALTSSPRMAGPAINPVQVFRSSFNTASILHYNWF
jgi:hypothetical protein